MRDLSILRLHFPEKAERLESASLREPVPSRRQPHQQRVRSCSTREPVGTALANRIEGLIGIKSGKGCDCKDLARKMDSWGISGCQKRRADIVATLVSHRDVLSAALKSDGHWIMAAAAEHAPDVILSLGAGRLLDLAIADIREGRVSPVKPATPSVKPVAKGIRSARPRRRGIGGAFTPGKGPVRFVTSAQFQRDILSLVAQIPPDITAIAGVARSGLSAATMLSMYLHLPMITIRQTMHDIVDTGNGWRLGGSKHIDPKKGKILVVDDTVMTGNSLRAIEPLIKSQVGEAVYAAIYVNPRATKKPDIWAVDLPWPHILEWNVFNSILSPSAAMDFDGILCHDCPPGSDDDGPKYLEFIRNARPLYTPRRCPVPLIVTARVEKYRAETEAWLRRHGIGWDKLVMHPAKSTREREKDNIAAYKAKHYAAWAKAHRPAPGPHLFFESEDRQARNIATISGLITVCPATAGVYGPQNSAIGATLQ